MTNNIYKHIAACVVMVSALLGLYLLNDMIYWLFLSCMGGWHIGRLLLTQCLIYWPLDSEE